MLAPLSCAFAIGLLNILHVLPVTGHEHTSQCIQDLGEILPCQQLLEGGLGSLRSNFDQCCSGIRTAARDLCECNPAIDAILGQQGQLLYRLEPICRLFQRSRGWEDIPRRSVRTCDSVRADFNYGCEVPDIDVDGARISSVLSFSETFANFATRKGCFDTPAFIDSLKESFVLEGATLSAAYGIGKYQGLDDMGEYLGMATRSLNQDMWLMEFEPDIDAPARLEVSVDGLTWNFGSTAPGSFLGGDDPYEGVYSESVSVFNGCEIKITDFVVLGTEGLRDWVERYVHMSQYSKRYGLNRICRYHTAYCADDPETSQYESEEECLEYLGSLPLYTDVCGPNRPLSGHSLPCKFKHHMMIPTNPSLHCPHIGKADVPDINGKFKCDDIECVEDEGQEEWPPVVNIGNRTPPERIAMYERNDVGFEEQPLPCIIPTG